MYVLMESVPYEGDREITSGNKEEIKQALRKLVAVPGVYFDDFFLVMESDIDMDTLRKEIRKEDNEK